MKRIKIFYIITGLNVGGAERLLYDTVRHLDDSVYEPVVVSLVGGTLTRSFREAGIRVMSVHMSNRWPLPGFMRLLHLVHEERPAIVHTHLVHADIFGRMTAKICGVPVIVSTLHMVEDARRKFPYKFLNRLTARWNTAFIAVSEAIAFELCALEGLPREKMNVIHNAVSDCGPPRKQEVRSLRSQLHVGEDDLLIGVVSRLEVPRKGHHVLFQALSSLPPVDAGVRCVVVGDGPGKGELLRHAASLGLESKVSFVGEQHNVPVWLDAMDIFVLPSLLEGSPIAIIEAMARALPIVATRTGGITEMIRDGTDGMLAEPGSWESLAQAMERLIRDAGLRSRLGSAARTRFESGFEIGAAVRATERLYTRLTRGTDSRRRIRLFEVVTNFEPGGVPRHMTDLIDGLDRDIFETRMVSGETLPERIPQNNVPHYRVPMVKRIDPVQDARSIRALVKLFRKEKPDMVHAHMSKANFLASIAARLSGVPVMLNTIHGQTTLERGWSLKQTVFDWCEWLALRFCTDMTISVSHAATRHLLTSHKVQRRRVITIHNGIDAQPVDEWVRETTRRALGLTGTHTVVLMTGRFAEPKRQETLVEACALLKFRYPGLVCLLAGDGPKRLELESLADRLGCASCVRILGHRADVPALLSAADVFALCSWQEGLSIAVLEAMAQGLPVIASRILGMDEPVVHGVTGYLVTEGSAEACAAALEIFLKDPGKRKKFGDAGRQRWMQYFGLSRQVAQTQQVLLACAKEKVRV